MTKRLHPFLPIKKASTKTQVEEKLGCSSPLDKLRHDPELKESLGINEELLSFDGSSDLQMYEVVSIVSDANAALLVHSGYRTRETAQSYLSAHGLDHLMNDSTDTVAQALDRRIPAIEYLVREDLRTHSSPYALDALELASSGSLRHHTKIVEAVLEGTVPLALIKKAGYVKLSKISSATILKALQAITEERTKLTMEGFSRGLDRAMYGPSYARDAITFGLLYGDKGITTSSPSAALRMHDYLVANHPERSEADRLSAALFAGELHSSLQLARKYPRLPEEHALAFHDSGAAVEDVVSGAVRLEQALAITSGMPASISSGLL